MKYICLGYYDPTIFGSLSEVQFNDVMDDCFAYDDLLRERGHFAAGEALQGPETAVTLRYRDGSIAAVDGPFAETKEVLGGILVLEARDLDHAVQLMSKHPGVRMGCFEIRPAADLNAMLAASEQRRESSRSRGQVLQSSKPAPNT